MISHLDHNGEWVLLVHALVLIALGVAALYTVRRTKKRSNQLNDFRQAEDD